MIEPFISSIKWLPIYNTTNVYFDSAPNHCPYIWSKNFFATSCKVNNASTNILLNKDDIIFYCTDYSSDKDFDKILCDLVFKIIEIDIWPDNNLWNWSNHLKFKRDKKKGLAQAGSIYINKFNILSITEHFIPTPSTHPWSSKFRVRKTYVSSEDSFQPQNANGHLIDILPIIDKHLSNQGRMMDESFLQINDSNTKYYGKNNITGHDKQGLKGLKDRLKIRPKEIPLFQLDRTLGASIFDTLNTNAVLKIYGKNLEKFNKIRKLNRLV